MKSSTYCLLSLLFISLTLACHKSDPDKPNPPILPQDTVVKPAGPVISSYIRGSYFETGQIDDKKLLANTDLIYFGANVYKDGSLFFELPVNDGLLTNASHVATLAGRSGVLQLKGENAVMDCGQDLLINKGMEGAGSFTFATWIYLDEWHAGSALFYKKESDNSSIRFELGNAASKELIFTVSNGTIADARVGIPAFSTGSWHHLALTYNGNLTQGNQLKVFFDGESINLKYTPGAAFPKMLPLIQQPFMLGAGLKAKLDESFVSSIALNKNELQKAMSSSLVFDNWNATKTVAYWKYDDAAAPAKDSRTWISLFNAVKSKIAGKEISFKMGLSGGDWKAAFSKQESIDRFTQQVTELLDKHSLEGVDFDFEWAESPTEWAAYNNAVVSLKKKLTRATKFSLSLHPLYYKLSPEAVQAVDFISIQCYGPNPNRFPLEAFKTDIAAMLNYGLPKEKLVMGLPFYAVASDNSRPIVSVAYKDIVYQHPQLDPAADEVQVTVNAMNKRVTFNGKKTIAQKVAHVKQMGLAGIMSWDLATDTGYDSDFSLLKCAIDEYAK